MLKYVDASTAAELCRLVNWIIKGVMNKPTAVKITQRIAVITMEV